MTSYSGPEENSKRLNAIELRSPSYSLCPFHCVPQPRVHKFPHNLENHQNSRRQSGNMKQVPHEGPRKITRHRRSCDLEHGIVHSCRKHGSFNA